MQWQLPKGQGRCFQGGGKLPSRSPLQQEGVCAQWLLQLPHPSCLPEALYSRIVSKVAARHPASPLLPSRGPLQQEGVRSGCCK
jgi:hypothetical protein